MAKDDQLACHLRISLGFTKRVPERARGLKAQRMKRWHC
jgi:hypothetical protein